jgi:hypothetical protein
VTDVAALDRWHDALGGMETVTLERANAVAALMTRRDRKYVVPVEVFVDAVGSLELDVAVLAIGERVVHHYRSLYFDTASLDLYRLAATGRRRRYKVRRREYVDDGVHMLEVKTKDARGRTVKERSMTMRAIDGAAGGQLTVDEASFVVEALRAAGIDSSPPLRPSVETGYRRSTLIAATEGWRATVDRDLIGASAGGADVRLGCDLVVETKSAGAPTALDRALWLRGVRPVRLSKFAVATAITRPGLAANRWNRVLRDHLAWQPPSHVM